MPYKLTRRLIVYRSQAFARQSGRCYYCGVLMCLADPVAFGREHGLTRRQVSTVKCTAEHLLARRDGGGDDIENIVAACLICNLRRHQRPQPLEPQQYQHLVVRRVRGGRWHEPAVLHGLMSLPTSIQTKRKGRQLPALRT